MLVRNQFIPHWKKKGAEKKNPSNFDASFASLGTNGAFINAKEVVKPLTRPTLQESLKGNEE